MTQGKSRMRQFRMSGSVRGAAREGGSYRDKFKAQGSQEPPGLSIHHGDGLNLDHHFGPRQFLDTDQCAGWIATLLKKLLAELRETRAVGHVGNEHRHGDDVIELAAGFFQSLPYTFEAQPHLPVKIAGVTLTGFVLECPVTG